MRYSTPKGNDLIRTLADVEAMLNCVTEDHVQVTVSKLPRQRRLADAVAKLERAARALTSAKADVERSRFAGGTYAEFAAAESKMLKKEGTTFIRAFAASLNAGLNVSYGWYDEPVAWFGDGDGEDYRRTLVIRVEGKDDHRSAITGQITRRLPTASK